MDIHGTYLLYPNLAQIYMVYTWYIPCIYHVYSCIYSLYTCWYSMNHLFFRISRLPSTKHASLSWHIWQRARSTRWGWFWYPQYTISVGNIGVQWHTIEFCRHASYLTGRDTTSTPSRLLSSSQTCIAGLWAPVVTHSTWSAINFGEEMSRYIHIHGICCVYIMYISVIYHVYVCDILYICMD